MPSSFSISGAILGMLAVAAPLTLPATIPAADLPPLSITLEGYDYPYPVQFLPLTIEGEALKMY